MEAQSLYFKKGEPVQQKALQSQFDSNAYSTPTSAVQQLKVQVKRNKHVKSSFAEIALPSQTRQEFSTIEQGTHEAPQTSVDYKLVPGSHHERTRKIVMRKNKSRMLASELKVRQLDEQHFV